MANKNKRIRPQDAALSELDVMVETFLDDTEVSHKVVARIYKDGRAKIEADTLEEAKQARAAMVEVHTKVRIAEAKARRAA